MLYYEPSMRHGMGELAADMGASAFGFLVDAWCPCPVLQVRWLLEAY